MAAKARSEQEDLGTRVADLEARLAAVSAGKAPGCGESDGSPSTAS
jgi:BMFP domain-containing protein YqiC